MPATDDNILLSISLPNIDRRRSRRPSMAGASVPNSAFFCWPAPTYRGLIDTIVKAFPDRRDPARIIHAIEDTLRERIFAIGWGYENANDLDYLRRNRAFKIAFGWLQESGGELPSQRPISRLENTPDLRALIRVSRATVVLWCQGYWRPPRSITLDIDDTADAVHAYRQQSLFNAHYDERYIQPIHIYDAETGH